MHDALLCVFYPSALKQRTLSSSAYQTTKAASGFFGLVALVRFSFIPGCIILTAFSPFTAGIPVCPIPPLHPDVTRQRLFFEHLDVLLHKPTLITDEATSISVKGVAPQLRSITLAELDRAPINSDKQHAIYPNRFPKSDDIACLMLTSGSTGNCKAVALSHSNLLSSISGKIRHHGTTPDSRFLNWIAFDHVACVSEIHLQALFADAR